MSAYMLYRTGRRSEGTMAVVWRRLSHFFRKKDSKKAQRASLRPGEKQVRGNVRLLCARTRDQRKLFIRRTNERRRFTGRSSRSRAWSDPRRLRSRRACISVALSIGGDPFFGIGFSRKTKHCLVNPVHAEDFNDEAG
jgi:hypothetical protein